MTPRPPHTPAVPHKTTRKQTVPAPADSRTEPHRNQSLKIRTLPAPSSPHPAATPAERGTTTRPVTPDPGIAANPEKKYRNPEVSPSPQAASPRRIPHPDTRETYRADLAVWKKYAAGTWTCIPDTGELISRTTGRPLAFRKSTTGHLTASITIEGEKLRIQKDRAIWIITHGPASIPLSGPVTIGHINRNPEDCRIQNLRLITGTEPKPRTHPSSPTSPTSTPSAPSPSPKNTTDKTPRLTPAARHADQELSRLTEGQIRTIRRRYAEEQISQTKLANLYGISRTTVSRILTRRTYQSIAEQ